jgi:hypothetical protein
LVHDPGALVLLRLPQVEHGPFGIHARRHPARIDDLEGVHDDAAAGIEHLRGSLVGTLNPDVRVPCRRRWAAFGLRPNGGDIATAEASDEVLAR